MSSTRRGVRGGDGADFFPTPDWATRLILPHLKDVGDGYILEPSAGCGAICKVLIEDGVKPEQIKAVELRPDGVAQLRYRLIETQEGDFLNYTPEQKPGLIIGTPPFRHALEHLEHAIEICASGGQVAFLLRLGFLASKKRAAFHKAHPADVYVLARRPSFTGKGADSADYMWWVHTKGQEHPGRVQVIGP